MTFVNCDTLTKYPANRPIMFSLLPLPAANITAPVVLKSTLSLVNNVETATSA